MDIRFAFLGHFFDFFFAIYAFLRNIMHGLVFGKNAHFYLLNVPHREFLEKLIGQKPSCWRKWLIK